MMSARFARKVGQCFAVDGFIKKREAGGVEKAVALCIDFPHQHIVPTWTGKTKYHLKMYGTVPIQYKNHILFILCVKITICNNNYFQKDQNKVTVASNILLFLTFLLLMIGYWL